MNEVYFTQLTTYIKAAFFVTAGKPLMTPIFRDPTPACGIGPCMIFTHFTQVLADKKSTPTKARRDNWGICSNNKPVDKSSRFKDKL